MKRQQWMGSLLLLFVAMIWGTAFVFQRVGMEQIEPITFTAVRMTLAAVAVGLASLRLKVPEAENSQGGQPGRRNTITGGICCGLFLALASIFQQMGIVTTTAGKAGFITALYILLVPLLNFAFFRKRNSPAVWFAVLLGVLGMYLLCVKEDLQLARGDALVGICAVLFSGHILCCDRFAGKGNPIRMSAVQFLTVAVISWAAAMVAEEPDLNKIRSAIIPIVYCGLISGGVGYTLQIVAQRYTEPAVASLLMSLESVFALLAGVLILGEQMTPRELLGCTVMFIAIVIAQLPRRNSGREKLPEVSQDSQP